LTLDHLVILLSKGNLLFHNDSLGEKSNRHWQNKLTAGLGGIGDLQALSVVHGGLDLSTKPGVTNGLGNDVGRGNLGIKVNKGVTLLQVN